MPFKRMASGNYRSPSGRMFTPAQVRAYYAKKRNPDKQPRKKPRRRHPIGKAGMGG